MDKASSTFLHVEVKTYLQQGPTSITKEGLKDVLKNAKNQHRQGDALFNNVLCASARLSSTWTKVNMLCFPNIPNRKVFKNELDEPIDDVFLKYILTQAELEKDNWLEDLRLGSIDASKEQYERLLAIMSATTLRSLTTKKRHGRYMLGYPAEKQLGSVLCQTRFLNISSTTRISRRNILAMCGT